MSGYGNIDKSQVVNCNDPWEQFPTWMDITLIIRAGTLCFPPPGLRARPALCPCLFAEKKQCCSQMLSPFTELLFCSLLLLNKALGICLIYFLPGILVLSVTYFPCPSFLPQHTTLVTSCLLQRSNISVSLYFGISTGFW